MKPTKSFPILKKELRMISMAQPVHKASVVAVILSRKALEVKVGRSLTLTQPMGTDKTPLQTWILATPLIFLRVFLVVEIHSEELKQNLFPVTQYPLILWRPQRG